MFTKLSIITNMYVHVCVGLKNVYQVLTQKNINYFGLNVNIRFFCVLILRLPVATFLYLCLYSHLNIMCVSFSPNNQLRGGSEHFTYE